MRLINDEQLSYIFLKNTYFISSFHLQYCSFETCGEGNLWGIPHGEFLTENSSWEIGFTVGNSSDSSWRIWECNIKMLLSMYARRRIVNLKQTLSQRLVPLSGCHGLLSYCDCHCYFSLAFSCRCHHAI